MNCVSWQDPRHICNNARVTTIALSRRAVHLSPRCIHICTSCAQTCNICKASSSSSTNNAIQRSDVNQNAPRVVQHCKSIGGFISRPILHIDSAASSQTPLPNDGTSSIVAHQGQTGAKYCRAITTQLANASDKSPRDSVASCSASLRSLISNAQLITHRCSHTSHTSPRRTARHGAVSAHRGSVDRAAGADTQYHCQGAPATVQLQVMLPSRARSFAASLLRASGAGDLLFSSVGRHLGHTLGPHWISSWAHTRPHRSQEKMIPINVASSEHSPCVTFRFGRPIVSLSFFLTHISCTKNLAGQTHQPLT